MDENLMIGLGIVAVVVLFGPTIWKGTTGKSKPKEIEKYILVSKDEKAYTTFDALKDAVQIPRNWKKFEGDASELRDMIYVSPEKVRGLAFLA